MAGSTTYRHETGRNRTQFAARTRTNFLSFIIAVARIIAIPVPFTPQQVADAQTTQLAAAEDAHAQIRVLAGPGTGKSRSIEERARWLLSNGVQPTNIVAVSFTRAAARDLEGRIRKYGVDHGVQGMAQVRVGTLHSVALRILKRAGLLAAFPVDPRVLDDWELSNIFDPEFGQQYNVTSKRRRTEIRRQHEAFWNTGAWNPPNYTPPDQPITAQERQRFSQFLESRGQLYSCVLPGEIVRKCVDVSAAGVVNLFELLNAQHLIADEYQDLNPSDLEFIDILAREGVTLFVSGDDDQSIYSFRHALPKGIQDFHHKYPDAGLHTLNDCFRCTPAVLNSAYSVVTAFPDPDRLDKDVTSLYANAQPPVQGVVHRWRIPNAQLEANAIADSCRDLIASGIPANQIMILLSSIPSLGQGISDALAAAGVPAPVLRPTAFADTPVGRLGLAALRIVGDEDDYVGLRTILGLRSGTGIATCNAIANAVHNNNLNLSEVFRAILPAGVFSKGQLKALNFARATIAELDTWSDEELLGGRRLALRDMIVESLGIDAAAQWSAQTGPLPDQMTLAEPRQYVAAPSEWDQRRVFLEASVRLGLAQIEDAVEVPTVQLMTMHSSKGLSAQVVFVPGLEEGLLPGPKRAPYPGLVSEAARLLFVAMTRARFACIASYAQYRITHGKLVGQTPSRFCAHLGGPFLQQQTGLTAQEVNLIAAGALQL